MSVDHEVQQDVNFQDVWQAIEKVLLEESFCQPGGGEEAPQFTQLAPVPQLQIPESEPGGGGQPEDVEPYIHTPQPADTCKVEDDLFPKSYEVATDPTKIPLAQ